MKNDRMIITLKEIEMFEAIETTDPIVVAIRKKDSDLKALHVCLYNKEKKQVRFNELFSLTAWELKRLAEFIEKIQS